MYFLILKIKYFEIVFTNSCLFFKATKLSEQRTFKKVLVTLMMRTETLKYLKLQLKLKLFSEEMVY